MHLTAQWPIWLSHFSHLFKMKFTSYFVRLKHDGSNFTGKIIKNDDLIFASFVKIEADLFLIHFKTQQEFRFFEESVLNSTNEALIFLAPAFSKYNKRKLKRLASLFSDVGADDNIVALLHLLDIENFLKCGIFLDFFNLKKEAFTDYLIKKEIANEIKIIDVNSLYLTSFSNYRSYLEDLHQVILNKYNKREKSFKLSEIEEKLKIPKESIFFKYLLNSLKQEFSFQITNDRISFYKLSLSSKDLRHIEIIEEEIASNSGIFSLDEMIKRTGLSYSVINDSVWNLIEEKKVVQLNQKFFMSNNELVKIINKLKKYKRNQGEMITIKLFRELTNYTRKHIIVILEYLDQEKMTLRVDNSRKILLPV